MVLMNTQAHPLTARAKFFQPLMTSSLFDTPSASAHIFWILVTL